MKNVKIQLVLSNLWDAQKTLCESRKKTNENRWIHVKEQGATRILFYSICAVVKVFITSVRIKEIECAFHFAESGWKKSTFKRCVIQNWEEIESLKNEKVLE